MLRRDVPFVALTATATDAVRTTIIKDLCMFGRVQLLTVPNKPHTKFSVETVNVDDLYSAFSWLIDELEQKQQDTAKVLVFCRKRAHVRDLYELFHEHLGEKSYVCPNRTEPKDDRTRLFAMYHRRTHKQVKETVEKEFCKANGIVRVVFCTVAFGMGVDVKGAQLVIHLGPSNALDDYLQECGRVGRDTNEMSHAVLLKYKGCTCSKNISKPMKEYIKNTSKCRRIVLMKEFSENPSKGDIGHACCDICTKICKCKCHCSTPNCTCSDLCQDAEYMSPISSHLTNATAVRNENSADKAQKMVSSQMISEVRRQLLEYRAKLANNIPHERLLTGLDLASGFSRALIDHVTSSLHLIDSYETLQKKFNFLSIEHAKYTWKIISDIISDVHSDSEEDADVSSAISNSDEDDNEVKDSTSGTDTDDCNAIRTAQRIYLDSSDDEHSGMDEL